MNYDDMKRRAFNYKRRGFYIVKQRPPAWAGFSMWVVRDGDRARVGIGDANMLVNAWQLVELMELMRDD